MDIIHSKGKSTVRPKRIAQEQKPFYSIIIVDDDNYLPPEYLERIEEKFRSDVKVAYIGVSTYLKCDVTPPEWFKEQSKFFAVGDLYEFSGVLRSGPVSVWGAGMAFRRCVWDQAYLSYVSPLVGRNSENLIAGEDSELCFLAPTRVLP